MTDTPFSLDRRDVLLSAAGVAAIALAGPSAAATRPADAIDPGRGQRFDLGWRFHRGAGANLEAPALNDSGWRAVDLPHDWSIEDLPTDPSDAERIRGPFDQKSTGGTYTGFTIGGEGWYRKRFRLANPRPGHVAIHFEGVYMDSDVWINGHRLGNHRNGYTPFAYDLTPYLSPNGDNVLAVRARNLGNNARWYAGSGIYRHVWLDVLMEPARLDRWGTQVVTRRIVNGKADIEIESRLQDLAEGLSLFTTVHDADGRKIWEGTTPAAPTVQQTFPLENARLWSPDRPHLYTATVELRRGKDTLDRYETPFGVRVIAFDAATGMTVNGIPTKLRGGCIHHDNGLLGSAAFDSAEQRKVALLKARGFNAVRPSHNLFSPAFLRACDAQGMMVICEAFDLWREPKFAGDYSTFFEQDWRADLNATIRSTRNHPSIIMWSIGNEIPGRNKPEGVEIQWQLANAVHQLDPTRPVTAAIHGFAGHVVTTSDQASRAGAAGTADRTSTAFLDIIGYNYKLPDYDADHARFPKRVFFGSESFPKDVFAIWEKAESAPWLIGDFVWTAMDYLGEAGIGGSEPLPPARQGRIAPAGWPWVNAYCGDIDLIGNQKPPSFARDVVWGVSALEIAVQRPAPEGTEEALRFWGWPDETQSWTWPAAMDRPLTVRAYTAGDRVELRLNGRPIATRTLEQAGYKPVEFTVPYAPGELEAIAYRGSVELARRHLSTVGTPTALRLRTEAFGGGAGRGDLSFVAVEIIDAKGRIMPDLEQDILVSVQGDGELVAFGSANPLAIGSYQSGTARSWGGRAMAVIRGSGRPGRAIITASSADLKAGMTSVRLR
jgi:beta-galactosidase